MVQNVEILEVTLPEMEPLTTRASLLPAGGRTMREHLAQRCAIAGCQVRVRADFWPSRALLAQVARIENNVLVRAVDGTELLRKIVRGATASEEFPPDDASIRLARPWDVLAVNEAILAEPAGPAVAGTVRDGATVDGILELGEGSVILPGVYIEGHAVIGRNCVIGPNACLRGATVIGDDCRIGQAVEIKNSVIRDHVHIQHLSYIGDSVVDAFCNLGAGSVAANLRHDGSCVRSMLDAGLVSTGRKKFGAVLGRGVHTGIHTGIYPGRKLWPGVFTLPGETVRQDKKQ